MKSAQSRIRQCSFGKDTWTRNAIFMFSVIQDRAIQIIKESRICFMYYAKAIDKEQHEDLFEVIGILLFGKDIRFMRILYRGKSTACGQKMDKAHKSIKTRQCLLSGFIQPLQELEILPGFIIGWWTLNNISNADCVLITGTEGKLKDLLHKLVIEREKKGITIICKKTECIFVSK